MAHVASYIVLAHEGEQRLIDAFDLIGGAHADDDELLHTSHVLATLSRQHLAALAPLLDVYETRRDEHIEHEPEDFFARPIIAARVGPIGLLRDLQDLMMLTTLLNSTWTVIAQGAKAIKDEPLKGVCALALHHNEQQARWLRTHLKSAAPQALVLGR